MTTVIVKYEGHSFIDRELQTDWKPNELMNLMAQIRDTKSHFGADSFEILCSSQLSYMIVTRFLMTNKVIA